MPTRLTISAIAIAAAVLLPVGGAAQGTTEDYQRANSVAERPAGLVIDALEAPHWIDGDRFWYRKSVTGGNVFVLVDAAARRNARRSITTRSPSRSARNWGAPTPASPCRSRPSPSRMAIAPSTSASTAGCWRCTLADASCTRREDAAGSDATGGGGRGSGQGPLFGGGYYGGDGNRAGDGKPRRVSRRPHRGASSAPTTSAIRPVGSTEAIQLSFDGAAGNFYDLRTVNWSPDSKRIAAYRVRPGTGAKCTTSSRRPRIRSSRSTRRCSTTSPATCSTSSSRCCSTSRTQAADRRRERAVPERVRH